MTGDTRQLDVLDRARRSVVGKARDDLRWQSTFGAVQQPVSRDLRFLIAAAFNR